MGIRIRKIGFFILLSSAFSACDKFEMRGFFLSYESADERFGQSMEWNSARPFREITVPVDSYTLFAAADIHVGGTHNLDILLDDAIGADVTAVIMVGDLTSGHAEDFLTFQQHLPDQDTLVTFQIPGNHDYYFDGWKQFYAIFGSATYLFTVRTPEATDLFICLDTGSGTLGSDQLEWLKHVLETERPNHRRCVVFTHNNLFRIRHTASTNPVVEELYVLADLCVRHEIDMVVTGHDHVKNEVALGNTRHITMDALLDDYKDAGYFRMWVEQGVIGYEFVELR